MHTPEITLARQIACVRRELALRRAAYPRWITSGRMNADTAEAEIAAMQAVLDTLQRLAAAEPVP